MKSLISLCLLWSTLSHAHVIVMSYPATQITHAEHLVQVMQAEHHIPAEFIEMVASTEPCRRLRTQSSWHLCINENGDLQEVAVDKSFLQETLKVFL